MPGNRAMYEAAMKRAAEHAWNQQWKLALAAYEEVAEEFADDPAVRGNLALCHYRLGNWERAEQLYAWLLANNPQNTFIMDRLIEVYRKLGRYTDAKTMQVRLNEINSRGPASRSSTPAPSPAASIAPGQAATGTGGLGVDPTKPNTASRMEMVERAMQYEAAQDLPTAVRYYEQAVAAGMDGADVYYSLGSLYQRLGQYEKAIERFSHCLDDADYAMSATYGTGVSLRALGRLEEGARMLSLAISLIDHSQIGSAEIDELITIYKTAVDALTDIGNYLQASNLAHSLADFLEPQAAYHVASMEFRTLAQELLDHLNGQRTDSPMPAPAPAPATQSPAAASPPEAPSTRTSGLLADLASLPPIDDVGVTLPEPRARPITSPLPDIEKSERLSTSYRRVTGPLVDPRTRPGMGSLDHEPATPVVPEAPAAGPSSTIAPPAPRRTRLHAISGPLIGLDRQPAGVRALAEEADANACAGKLRGAMDACLAMVAEAPDFLPAQLRLAELHAINGETTTALNIAQAVLRLLELRREPLANHLPLLRLIVRLRPGDEAALSTYIDAAHKVGQMEQAAPLARRLVYRLLNRGATSRAMTEAARLAEALPDDKLAALNHASTLLIIGRPAEALEIYRRLLPELEVPIPAIIGANAAFAALGQEASWWSSLESLVHAAREAPRPVRVPMRLYRRLAASEISARVRVAAALLLLHAGRPRDARAWLRPLLTDARIDPRLRAVALHSAALTAEVLGELGIQIELRRATVGVLLSPATHLDTATIQVFGHPFTPIYLGLELANLLAKQGEITIAIQTLETLRQAVPPSEDLFNRLSELHLEAGRLGDALAALDALASYHRDAGRLEPLAAVLDRMSELAPNNIAVKTKLIDAYLQRGFVDQARRELELRAQLQASSGKLSDAVASLQRAADIAWTVGRFDDAFALCDQMLSLQPGNADARQYLITLYLQAGQVERAVEHSWALATMYINANNHRDAIAALHQIIGLSPEDAEAHHRLGEALAAVGEFAQAERVYRRLTRYNPDDTTARARLAAMAALANEAERGAPNATHQAPV